MRVCKVVSETILVKSITLRHHMSSSSNALRMPRLVSVWRATNCEKKSQRAVVTFYGEDMFLGNTDWWKGLEIF
jgi:hypothetical protein